MSIPYPNDEEERLKQLKKYKIFDTPPEPIFDDLTFLASYICQTPISLITLLDERRQWFKSKVGLNISETPREIAFCSYAIVEKGTLTITDALQDERFKNNPLVVEDPKIRFYMGAPLLTKEGNALGTLCVIDFVPRTLTQEQQKALEALSRQVILLLESRLKHFELLDSYNKLGSFHAELEKKNKDLQLLNEQKNQFLGMAAHDLRNPLFVIQGYSSLLLDNSEIASNSNIKHMLERIQQSSEYMLQLISNLLDLAVIESGKLQIDLQPTDLKNLIQGLIVQLTPFASKKQVKLEFESPESVPLVSCDHYIIEQVMNNLISNGVKFSHSASKVRVSLTPRIHDVLILVNDEGIGMSEDVLKNIFEPFSRGALQGTGVEKGAGLGLAIVKKNLLSHKGDIRVESTPGKGSTFYVTLPYKPS